MLSGWLASQQAESVQTIALARFTQESRVFSEALAQRLATHTEIVRGLRGLFVANPDLDRAAFNQAATEQNVTVRFPGIRNLVFTRRVPETERPAFEARIRAEGFADFALYPPGDRPVHYVNDYVWPGRDAESLMGLDLAARPTDLASIEYGRTSGRITVSEPFDLPGEETNPSAIQLRVPVFDRGTGPVTDAGRFLGVLSATVRIHDTVKALHGQGFLQGVNVTISDRGSVLPGPASAVERVLLAPPTRADEGAMTHERELLVHDRRWRLVFHPTVSFLSVSESRLPWLAGLAGGLVSLLLGTVVGLLVRQNAQAQVRERASDDARRTSEGRFRALFNQAAVGVAQLDAQTGRFARVNQRYCDITGYTETELLALDFQSISDPADVAEDRAQMERLVRGEIAEFRIEKRLVHRQGHSVWIDLTVSPMWEPDARPDFFLAVVQDISVRKQMEQDLRGNELRMRGILQRLPLGVCLVQANGQLAYRNERFVEICGYSEQEVATSTDWWLRTHPDVQGREGARATFARALELAARTDVGIAPYEMDIVCRDGQRRVVEVSGVLLGEDHLITMVDLSPRKAAEEEIRNLAYYDPLTRLPNRRLLRDRLQQALAASSRHHRWGALLLLDLDNFKNLNETQGHEQGDLLLAQVAHRLSECVHEDDTVARPGGDEFVVVLEDLGSSAEEAAARCEETAQRILAAMREPYQMDGENHHSSLSMGVALFTGTRETVDELLRRADLAMYQAKAAGRDTLRFYDPQMQAVVSARVAMELDMRIGLEQGQFDLYYQPQIDGDLITGAEGLLRWKHPRDGFVSPGQFIPLAEESGLILRLGEWVLQTACRQLALWAQQPLMADMTLAVNVSPVQFRQEDFVGQVLAALAGSGAHGPRLKLEITEGLLLNDVEDTIAKMGQLRAYGVGFSLDDFGTGYSSLAYLKRLPLDQLKIDQGFVRDVLTDPNDAAIARTVVALGTSLGLRVIAEGVETEAQREFLARHHCHAWQGYLLSPAVPAADLAALVRRVNGSAGGTDLPRGAAVEGVDL